MSFRDKQFEWEKTYQYRVVGLTRVLSLDGAPLSEFEGEAPPPLTVLAHDVFPPDAPTGLQAVFTQSGGNRFIDLTWSPSEATDVAGYNLYRQAEGGSAQKLNRRPIVTPSFRDDQVLGGAAYTYQVTAVDARGNESAASEPAREKVPQ